MRPENWPHHLRKVSEKIQNVIFSCDDFQTILENIPNDSFAFIDPPYFNADKAIYTHNFTLEDHYRLKNTLVDCKSKFLLTYDNAPEIIDLYKDDFEIVEQGWKYRIGRSDDQKTKKQLRNGFKGNRTKGKEVFIKNY
jgi:DNA adenine methylase